jgi:hypothetical protein
MAPIVAPMMAETIPLPRWIPNCGSNQLPIRCADNPNGDVGNETKAGALYN